MTFANLSKFLATYGLKLHCSKGDVVGTRKDHWFALLSSGQTDWLGEGKTPGAAILEAIKTFKGGR